MRLRMPSVKGLCFRFGRIAPDVATIVGGVLCIAAPISAAIQTYKHYNEIVDDHHARLAKMDEAAEIVQNEEGKEVPEKDKKNNKTINYLITAGKFAKTYALPIVMTIGGVVLMAYGKHAYKARYLGASAALGASMREIAGIKSRGAEKLTEEMYKEVIDGVHNDVVTVTETDDNGYEITTTEPIVFVDRLPYRNHPHRIGLVDFLFDSLCYGIWDTSTEITLSRLKMLQSTMNDRFNANGFLYLNDVLGELRMDLVPDGYTLGWSKFAGSTYVDFGLNNIHEKMNVALASNSTEFKNCCVLSFNVAGDIRNKMYRYQVEEAMAA